jgi:hypothetical protein
MDWDAGSGSPPLVPTQIGTLHPNLLIAGKKKVITILTIRPQGRIYVVDHDSKIQRGLSETFVI